MVKKAMPAEVQKLTKMELPLFSEPTVHHVENHRREKQSQNTNLVTKLTKLPIGELIKQKQNKEKTKSQAVVTVAQAHLQKNQTHQLQCCHKQPAAPQTQTEQKKR